MSKVMNVRIEGGWHPRSWIITDVATGEKLPVTDLRIHVTPEKAEVTITVIPQSIDIVTDAVIEEANRNA